MLYVWVATVTGNAKGAAICGCQEHCNCGCQKLQTLKVDCWIWCERFLEDSRQVPQNVKQAVIFKAFFEWR